MRSLYDENTLWPSYDGRIFKLKDLSDDHLINVIYHVQQYSYQMALLPTLMKIAKKRGLTQKDLDKAQIAHRKGGKRFMWNYETHEMEAVK